MAAVEPVFVKQRQSNVDIRLSTSQPFFYQISTLKQRRVPGGKSSLESDQHALQIRLKLFGEDHSDCTARSYNNIAITQHEMKDCKSALESDQHALQIRLKLFGEEHSDTVRSYNNIGVTQNEMKDYKSALESHQHAL